MTNRQSTPKPRKIAEAWKIAIQLTELLDAQPPELPDPLPAQLAAVEQKLIRDVLRNPITNNADAIAKLQAIGLSFGRGERPDGLDEDALLHVLSWVEQF